MKKNRKKNIVMFGIISKIKNRSKRKNVLNEISKDIEKVKLEPEELILLEFIEKKISKD